MGQGKLGRYCEQAKRWLIPEVWAKWWRKKKKSPEDIRDREKVKMAKGGRAMYGSGARVCKLAKRGKGKAYGKNS